MYTKSCKKVKLYKLSATKIFIFRISQVLEQIRVATGKTGLEITNVIYKSCLKIH